MRDGASFPMSRLRAGRAGGGVAMAGHGGMDLCRMRSDEHSRRGKVWFGSKSLSLYCIRCKHHTIALLYRYAIAIVARAIVGETTM